MMMTKLAEILRNREWAEKRVADRQGERAAALVALDDKVAEAVAELNEAKSAEEAERARIMRSLSEWSEYDGSGIPVAGDTMVHWRVKCEWEQMKAGETPSLTESPGGGRADGYNWDWRGNEVQDIAAYRVVPAQRIETRRAKTAKPVECEA
jgi:hypothetical protein